MGREDENYGNVELNNCGISKTKYLTVFGVDSSRNGSQFINIDKND